jgi:nitrogen fixation/metabolism regulation signal transduction histidine kinase
VTRPAAPPARRTGPPPWRSRFSLKLVGALLLAATLPLVPALLLANWLADSNAGVWLAPRVAERLSEIPGTYQELFRARKALYAEQARSLARGLPRPAQAQAQAAYLQRAVAEVPRLQHVELLGPDGLLLAEAERPRERDEEGGWRPVPASVTLPGGGTLRATFTIEAALFAELDETRELAETARDMDRARGELRRSILLVFAAMVVVAALLAVLLGHLMARRTVARLALLAEAHRRVAGGDLAARVAPGGEGGDEVEALAAGFNVMVEEVRQGRDRIVYLEKISGWQEVARRLAHEIKNPLTPIQLAFQQLEARWRATPGGDERFGRLLGEASEIVRQEVATLQRLVEEFSAFARLPDVAPAPADLGAFVAEFIRTSPQLVEQAEVTMTLASDQLPVALDGALMRRVLVNLAENAVQAAAPARARLHFGVARSRDRAVLTVADEGPGVEWALRPRVFDPYFTTKGEGTGLGLAIVKKIVLQHGGEVELGERPGGGACFTIALPLAPVGAPPRGGRETL